METREKQTDCLHPFHTYYNASNVTHMCRHMTLCKQFTFSSRFTKTTNSSVFCSFQSNCFYQAYIITLNILNRDMLNKMESPPKKPQHLNNILKNSGSLVSSSSEDSTASSPCVHLPTMQIKGPLLGSSELIKNFPRKEAVLQITTWNM